MYFVRGRFVGELKYVNFFWGMQALRGTDDNWPWPHIYGKTFFTENH